MPGTMCGINTKVISWAWGPYSLWRARGSPWSAGHRQSWGYTSQQRVCTPALLVPWTQAELEPEHGEGGQRWGHIPPSPWRQAGLRGARLKTPLETRLSVRVIWGTPSPSRDRCPCPASGLWAASGPCSPDKAALLMGDRANSLVQAGDSSCPLHRAGSGDCPHSAGGIHLLLGHAGNFTCMSCSCLQPACPPHALHAGDSVWRRIAQGYSLLDRRWPELIPLWPSSGDGTINV